MRHGGRAAIRSNGDQPSSDHRRDRQRQRRVALGVDLRRVRAGMPEQHLGGFQAVGLADARCERVAEMVRVPVRYASRLARPRDRSA